MTSAIPVRQCVCGAPQDADGRCTGLLSAQAADAEQMVDRLAEQLWNHFSTSGRSFRTPPATDIAAWQAEVECFRRTAREMLVTVTDR